MECSKYVLTQSFARLEDGQFLVERMFDKFSNIRSRTSRDNQALATYRNKLVCNGNTFSLSGSSFQKKQQLMDYKKVYHQLLACDFDWSVLNVGQNIKLNKNE